MSEHDKLVAEIQGGRFNLYVVDAAWNVPHLEDLQNAITVDDCAKVIAAERARCAGIVAEYVKEMKCERDESLLKECVKEIADGE